MTKLGERVKASVQGFRGGVQAFVVSDAGTASEGTVTYSGNEYKTYDKIIKAVAEKYQAKAAWGCQPLGNIIDVRSAFIIGDGVNVSPVDPKDAEEGKESNEVKFCKEFFDYNDLDRETPQEYAKEAEIEGCFLGQLTWSDKDKMVGLKFISRVEKSYKVITPDDDYSWYQGIEFSDSKMTALKEEEFIYARFGGRVHLPNEPTPKVGKVLTEIESMSKAIRDWREINNLFATPIPYIKCETPDQAKWMRDNYLEAVKNWKAKKLFILTGTPGYLMPGENPAVEKEIVALAKIISGATGVPVHFLGLPDLMSNRATADNLMELVAASTRKERMIWLGTYLQIIQKAMAIWNLKSAKTKLDPKKVTVSIPYISAETWARIKDIYLPLYQEDVITKKTLLTQVPGINVVSELKALEEAEAKRFNAAKNAVDEEDEDEEGQEDDRE